MLMFPESSPLKNKEGIAVFQKPQIDRLHFKKNQNNMKTILRVYQF